MNKYTLYALKFDTVGKDGQVNLRLHVTREHAPERLSDFDGGSAEIENGYTTHTFRYEIKLADFDERRIYLVPSAGNAVQIDPEFIRKLDPSDPLNQLVEVPLKLRQRLSEYIITNSSWGLK